MCKVLEYSAACMVWGRGRLGAFLQGLSTTLLPGVLPTPLQRVGAGPRAGPNHQNRAGWWGSTLPNTGKGNPATDGALGCSSFGGDSAGGDGVAARFGGRHFSAADAASPVYYWLVVWPAAGADYLFLSMAKNHYARLVFWSAVAVLATALPAQAEFVWNPFDHMTPDEARDTILLTVFMIFFGLVGIQLVLATLAYWTLKYKYPRGSARFKVVFLYTYGAYWVGALVSGLLPRFPWPGVLHSLFLWLGIAVSIGITLGGAAVGYFQKPKQT